MNSTKLPEPLVDPLDLPIEEQKKLVGAYLALDDDQVLEMYKKHRDRCVECVKLLDQNTREFPHYRNGPYWARQHLMEEIIRLERIILSMEERDEKV